MESKNPMLESASTPTKGGRADCRRKRGTDFPTRYDQSPPVPALAVRILVRSGHLLTASSCALAAAVIQPSEARAESINWFTVGAGMPNATEVLFMAFLMVHHASTKADLMQWAVEIAPVTEPLPEQRAPQQQEPPLVTSEDQVVPAEARRVVRRWTRRLRRCLRAARRGDTRLARRLRPADLFLPHEDSSLPDTAAWIWDLTPLDRGLPAVPHPVSGVGCPPDTRVLLQAWRNDSMGFTDRAIVDEVSRGVSDDSQCVRGTLLCAPYVGALECYDVAVGKLQQGVEAGYATPPHA